MKMNAKIKNWSRRYQSALRRYLNQGSGASLQPALRLGNQAVAIGLETLALAGCHKQALMVLMSPGGSSGARAGMIGRARRFFAETIVPIEKNHRAALKADIRVNQLTRTLRRSTMESFVSNCCLKRSMLLRRAAEHALKKSGKQHAKLLAEAHRLQKHLRYLTHESMSMQEGERQKTSRQLHDEIAQTLIAIDLRLLTLKKSARANTGSLKKEIDKTQRLVRESLNNIHRFTNESAIKSKT